MKRLLFYSSVCLLMILFYGCTHQVDGKQPKVTTGNIAMIPYPNYLDNDYLVSGYIEANGAVVLTYGICYSMSDKKPDINGHHIDATRTCSSCFDGSSPIRQGEQKQSFVVQFLQDLEYDELMWENWNVIYVRAYATTADGTVVYGKTETYHPEDCMLPEWYNLFTRTNGWKLVSITDVDHGSSLNDIGSAEWGSASIISTGDILFFNSDGRIQNLHGYVGDWHLKGGDMIEDFYRNGSSASFHPNPLAYYDVKIGICGVDYTYYTFQTDRSNSQWEISTNIMRIKGISAINYDTSFNCELVFVPVP